MRSKYGLFRKFSGYPGTNRGSRKNCSDSLNTVRPRLVQGKKSGVDARQHCRSPKVTGFTTHKTATQGEVDYLVPAPHVVYWPLAVSSAGWLIGFMPCEIIESSDI
jgi:hypothetical protein